MNDIPFAVDSDGNELLKPLLGPFFLALFPAFKNKADEIVIKAHRSDITDLSVNYIKNAKVFCLSSNFQPFITSSRIRLIAGMILEPDKSQTGEMLVHFEGRILPVEVEIQIENDFETLSLKPIWGS